MIYGGADVKIIRRLNIYNRWGGTLFSASNFVLEDPAGNWDGIYKGKVINSGVYLYHAEIEFLDGRIERIAGDITVIQ